MAAVPILDYVNSLPIDTARDGDSVIYGTNAGGDTKIPCNKLVSEWSTTHQYGAGETCVTGTGLFYYAVQANSNKDPTNPSNAAYWQPTVGSGSGSGGAVNFLSNPLRDANVSGWAASGNCSIAYSSSQDLYDGGALAITKTAGSTGTVEGDLSEIMSTQVGQAWMLKIFNWIDSGATLAAGDVYFQLYDGTTTIAIADSSILLNQLVSQSYPAWPTNTIGSTWKLRIQFKAAAVCVMRIADVSVAPQSILSVPKRSGWIPYPSTPVPVGFGTCTGITAEYCFDGEDMLIQAKFTAGTVTAVEARFPLPIIGFTSRSTIQTIQVAGAITYGTSGALSIYALIEPSKDYIVFGLQNAGNAGGVKLSNATAFSSSTTFSIQARIPLAQATSSIQVSGEETIYLSNTESVVNTNGVVGKSYYGIEGAALVANTATTYYDITLPRPVGVNEKIEIQVRSKVDGNWINKEDASVLTYLKSFSAAASQVATPYGISVRKPATGQIRLWFGQIPGLKEDSTASTWANVITTAADGFDRWRVRISKGGAGAEVPPVVSVITADAASAASAAALIWASASEDTHGSYNATTGEFTCKVAGLYELGIASSISNTSEAELLYAFVGAVNTATLANQTATATARPSGSTKLRLKVGDVVTIRHSVAASRTYTTARANFTRIGS